LTEQLEALWVRFRSTERKRSATEAPEESTSAYVQLLLAYGFARLGQSELSRELRDLAVAQIPQGDPIHRFLREAYSARVDQALEGRPAETPLPAELAGQLNQLGHLERFKVDRLRSASVILEPHEHLNPFSGFTQKKSDPRGEEFASMRGMTDGEELAEEVAKVMDKALDRSTSVGDRDRLLDGVMDFFPMLPEAQAVPHLQTLVRSVEEIPLPRRCMLLQEALMLAGFFGREGMVRDLSELLKRLIGELGGDHAAEVASAMAQALRSLRRVGLLDEAAELLTAATDVVTGGGSAVMAARLQLAAGLAEIGRPEQATSLFKEGRKALKDPALLPVDKQTLTRAMATACGYMPLEFAIAELSRLSGQISSVTDSFSTNSHFCLSVIQFMESMVLGYVSEQLALGELGRRWLDEDEYLVRRRIHRDLGRAQCPPEEQ
jgi:hypothetical protein